MPRRGRGEGSIQQVHGDEWGCPALVDGVRPKHRCTGPWRAVLDHGRVGGKRIRRSVMAPTKREVLVKLDRLRGERQRGFLPSTVTVDQWIAEWLGFAKIAPTTAASYRSKVRLYITPALGSIRLVDLRPEHVRALARGMHDRGLSPATVRQTLAILQRSLAVAMKDGLIERNVAAMVDKPEAGENHHSASAWAEAVRMIDAAPDVWTQARLAVALYGGLRRSEALGLRRGDLDLDARLIHVTSSLHRVDGAWVRKEPKSERGKRVVPLTAAATEILRAHLAANVGPEPDALLFCRANGEPIHARDDWQLWMESCDRAGVARFTPHGSRATGVTAMLEAGVPAFTVARTYGHDPVTMERAYARAMIDAQRAAAAVLEP